MASLRIKIGAAADQRSFDVVFGSLEKRGLLASQKVAKDWAKLFKTLEIRATKAGAHIEKALGGKGKGSQSRTAADHAKPAIEGAKRATVEISHELRKRLLIEKTLDVTTHKLKLQQIRREEAEKLKALKREREQEKRNSDRALRSFANRTSHRATRFLWSNTPISSVASNFGRGVLGGAGMDLSFGGGIARNAAVEANLVGATNSARFGGQEIDLASADRSVREISNRYGMSREDTTSGVLEFQKKTGDLELGFEIADQLSKLAVATGTEFRDMANAAGDVSNVLGDVPDKGKRIIDVFETIAGQGAKGAVEISDLASGMAKLGAAASKFEGDAGLNLKKMGALAQFARATGGAASASEAANAVARFSDQLSTPARMKEFKAAGVDLYSKDSPGQLLDPFEIIKNSLAATKGDPGKLSKLFASSIGKKPVQAMSKTFLEAGGATNPEAGLAALDKMIAEQMQGAELGKENVQKALDAEMNTLARQTQILNNQWDDSIRELQGELVPALQEASPAITDFAKTVGDLAIWTVEHPKRAIASAIGLSIARAGIESTMRTAIDKAITAGGPAMLQAVGTQAGAAFASLGALSIVATAVYLTTEAIHEDIKKGQNETVQGDVEFDKKLRSWEKRWQEEGMSGFSSQDSADIRAAISERYQRLAAGQNRAENGDVFNAVSDYFGGLFGIKSGESTGQTQVDATEVGQEDLRKQIEQLEKVLTTSNLTVRVSNPDDFPKPDGGGGGGGGGPTGFELPVPGR